MQLRPEIEAALEILSQASLVRKTGSRYISTRRWHGAMARASLQLISRQEKQNDLRLPITLALTEIFKDTVTTKDLVTYVAAMLYVESQSLGIVTQPDNDFRFLYRG